MAPVQLRFSRSLYDAEAVDAAVAAFGHLAELSVDAAADEVVVTVADPHPALADRLADELANHVLFHTVLHRRRVDVLSGARS